MESWFFPVDDDDDDGWLHLNYLLKSDEVHKNGKINTKFEIGYNELEKIEDWLKRHINRGIERDEHNCSEHVSN